MTTIERVCRMDIEALRMAWRPRNEGARLVVGTVSHEADSYRFRYDGIDLAIAQASGFQGYPGLPVEPEVVYNGRAMDAFRARLPKTQATRSRPPSGALGSFCRRNRSVRPPRGHRRPSGHRCLRIPSGAHFDLVPEPGNIHDPRAIRLDFDGRPVGYLRKVVSDRVLQARESGLSITCTLVREVPGNGQDDIVVAVGFETP